MMIERTCKPRKNVPRTLLEQLRQSAAKAYREGKKMAARAVEDIAEAAERMWLRQSKDDQG